MGRIKTQLVKRVSHKLVAEYGQNFKDNFEENKVLAGRFADIQSKKIRNMIAGYITRLVKRKD